MYNLFTLKKSLKEYCRLQYGKCCLWLRFRRVKLYVCMWHNHRVFIKKKQPFVHNAWLLNRLCTSRILCFYESPCILCSLMSGLLSPVGCPLAQWEKSKKYWFLYNIFFIFTTFRVVCPNFGHPALTSLFIEWSFLQVKNSFATIVNKLSVLKLFQLSNGDLLLP